MSRTYSGILLRVWGIQNRYQEIYLGGGAAILTRRTVLYISLPEETQRFFRVKIIMEISNFEAKLYGQ